MEYKLLSELNDLRYSSKAKLNFYCFVLKHLFILGFRLINLARSRIATFLIFGWTYCNYNESNEPNQKKARSAGRENGININSQQHILTINIGSITAALKK